MRVAILLLVFGAAGCGDDSTGPTPDAGGGGMDSGGTGGMCANPADMAALEAMYPGPMGMRTIQQVAGDCAVSCAFDAMPEPCFLMCIHTDTMNMVSDPCISCLGVGVRCARDNCLSRCISDPMAADCLACQCGDNAAMINCRTEFTNCSGVVSHDCDGM